jgi:hypothetical protein
MKLYRVNYEEYLHYEEFIEATSEEEAERIFKNSIDTLEPVEGETYTFDVTDADERGETDGLEHTNAKTSDGTKHQLGKCNTATPSK